MEKLMSSMAAASASQVSGVEIMGLGFFILPNIILVTGLLLSIVIFVFELTMFKIDGKPARKNKIMK